MFEHCLYFNTTSLARKVERIWTRAFKPFGLTPSQAFMLRVVLAEGPITHTQLADRMNISKATCSRSVDGLQKLGLVDRKQTSADGRSFELVPTDKALGLKTDLNETSAAVTKKLKHLVGNEVFETTVTKIKGINAAID